MHTVVVTTTATLTAAQRSKVNKVAQSVLKTADFEIEEVIDPEIIGGIKITFNSLEFDGTLKGKFDKVRAQVATDEQS